MLSVKAQRWLDIGKTLLAMAVAVGALAAVMWSVDTNRKAEYYLFHFIMPMQLFLAGVLTWHVVRELRHRDPQLPRQSWRSRTGKIAAIAINAWAWWHEIVRGQILRAADMAGFPDAVQAQASDYRLVTRSLLVLAPLIAVREFTRDACGEWCWLTGFLALCALILFAEQWILWALTWVYRLAVGV
jgi:hypothetical protein